MSARRIALAFALLSLSALAGCSCHRADPCCPAPVATVGCPPGEVVTSSSLLPGWAGPNRRDCRPCDPAPVPPY
jgi:hypothetical protein